VIARSVRRLPGVQFESRPPRLVDVLPRMDVAVFVGFAAAGPLHVPVAIDDPRLFADVFGDDAPLAWDRERCELRTAALGPTVRSFLRNGGSRCWVIRVARTTPTADDANNWARANRFAVPALARWSGTGLAPAFVAARSEGSWSDTLGVGSALALQPATITQLSVGADGGLAVTLEAPDTIELGDALRLTWPSGDALLAAVVALSDDVATLSVDQAVWLLATPPLATGAPWSASWFPRGESPEPLPPLAAEPVWSGDGTVTLTLLGAAALRPGQLVRLTRGQEQAWVLVDDTHAVSQPTSPPTTATAVSGHWSRPGTTAPAGLPAASPLPVCERVRVELYVRQGDGHAQRLGDLGLAPGHPRCLGALPSDRLLFAPDDDLLGDDEKALRDRLRLLVGDGADLRAQHAELWQTVATPRFPLAVDRGRTDLFVPLAMPIVPGSFLDAAPLPGDPGERDGLARFDAALFLDPGLADASASELGAQADFLRWQQPSPRRLVGIHAAYSIDEATLIAVPDALQRGWSNEQAAPPVVLDTPLLTASSDGQQQWHLGWTSVPGAAYALEQASSPSFGDAQPVALAAPGSTGYDVPATTASGTWFRVRAYVQTTTPPSYFDVGAREIAGSFWSDPVQIRVPPPQFLDCPPGALGVPVATLADAPDLDGSYRIAWSAVPGAIGYEVQESTALDFGDAVTVFAGDATSAWLYGRAPGRYHYRVRARGSLATVSAPLALGGDSFRFDVTDVGTPAHLVAASFVGAIGEEIVFDGSVFTEHYAVTGTTRAALADGYRYVVTRQNGWPGAPSFRAWDPAASGAFGNGVAVIVAGPPRRVLVPVSAYAPADKATMLTVQAALLRLCAARGDLLAVLGLPEHYREADAARHGNELRALTPEETPWSYGALYHPWLLVESEGTADHLRAPPDGAVTGVMAGRAVRRGAWIAPANEPLQDVLGLTPTIARDQWGRLLDAHVNLVRQEPHGFVTLSADTLARDADLTPINVRRLLILLRRAALRLGTTFVFEPNNDIFRRAVERGFAGMLDEMFRRGAFAGASAADSYQVVVDTSVNSDAAQDLGQFIVELKVAPSLPLAFLTVRLVQSGGRGQVTEAS
jgi:hypothetical protein